MYRLLIGLGAVIMGAGCRGSIPVTGISTAPEHYGGYSISTDFNVDARSHAIVIIPSGARQGDLLSIRPFRLKDNEYLVLQKCNEDCADVQVVRAWNSGGVMDPLAVISNKVPIEAGATYLIWMQQISVKGAALFPQCLVSSPALIFKPAGPASIFAAADLDGARARGPTSIVTARRERSSFLIKFDGGTSVRMQLLRPEDLTD